MLRGLPETICVSCTRATPVLCDWIGGDEKNLEGREYIKKVSNNGEMYSITKCKKFKRGPLPKPAWGRG